MNMPTDEQAYFIALANTLGHSVLIEILRSAAYYATHSNTTTYNRQINSKIKEGSSCFIFIQGTGLETIIQTYSLSYNADRLKEGFNQCLRQNIHPLV